MVEKKDKHLSTKRKCALLNVVRSAIYYKSKPIQNDDAIVMNEAREIYQQWPFYGYRRILVELRKRGFYINHKRLQRLLVGAGIRAIYPGKKTTVRNHEHKVFPYLLRGLKIERPGQVYQVDITYIKMRHGFVYLVCLIDVFSRKVMGWALSTFLDTTSCLEALDKALKQGKPEIVNSDQGCQFTSVAWTESLTLNNIFISMDGKGRWADNVFIERLWRSVKYENVFLHSFDTVDQARKSLDDYINFYNQKRPHQALNYHTPDEVYRLKRIPTKQELFEGFSMQNILNQEAIMIPKFV